MALTQLETALARLKRLSPRQKIEMLYELRHKLDEDSFRHVATLLAVNMSQGENPKRWAPIEDVERYDEEEAAEDPLEASIEDVEFLEDDEYVGKSVVERLWKSNI